MIPESKITEVRDRSDIVAVIGDYVTLRRAGANYKGVCPFHADSDPSFNVNPARQFFHCFGCGASGDVFKFVSNIDGIGFYDAVQLLAERFNVELPEPEMTSAARTAQDRAREAAKRRRFVLERAASFFEERLWSPEGEAARRALAERGVSEQTAREFRIGFAPDSWTALRDALQAERINPREMLKVGLVRERQSGGVYDAFRDRLMFTVSDPGGRPIAFSGRSLSSEEDAGAKYINSPETPEYTKSKVLFGLHQARVGLSKTSEALLVEGNFDVVSLYEAGLRNVVAPLGTALTESQTALLRLRVEKVVLMFDGDDAGKKAAVRAFPTLAKAGLASYVVPLPRGEDPDSFVREKGPAALKALLDNRRGLLDQIIEDEAADCDGSIQDVVRRIRSMRSLFEHLRTRMERDLYRQRLAGAFGVEERAIAAELRGARTVGEAKAEPKERKAQQQDETKAPQRAERELMGLFLDCPEMIDKAVDVGVVDLVSDPHLKKLLCELVARRQRKETHVADLVTSDATTPLGAWLAKRALEKLYDNKENALRALFDIRAKLVREIYAERIRALESDIQEANAKKDVARVFELSRQKADLQRLKEAKKAELFDSDHARA